MPFCHSAVPLTYRTGFPEGVAKRIVVHGTEFQVIGVIKLAICDNRMHARKRYYFLSGGQRFNLATRRPDAATDSST